MKDKHVKITHSLHKCCLVDAIPLLTLVIVCDFPSDSVIRNLDDLQQAALPPSWIDTTAIKLPKQNLFTDFRHEPCQHFTRGWVAKLWKRKTIFAYSFKVIIQNKIKNRTCFMCDNNLDMFSNMIITWNKEYNNK